MRTVRLDSDERRKVIVAAAIPLFARKGFAGTTTREIAEAAGISEALLFRHFPSKQLLYREILQLGCEGDPALEKLATLPASTETLVCMVRYMVRRFVLGRDAEPGEMDTKQRLVLHSFLEDGVYARELFDTIFERVVPLWTASLAAAAACGEATARDDSPENQFWFAHHIAAMAGFSALPGQGCVPYAGERSEVAEQAIGFILRGLGVSEAAVTSYSALCPERALESAAD